jgi:phosphatidylglycerol lysyltransferase
VQYFLPFGVFHWTRALTLVMGFILVYLSLHLFQRRRAAWWVAVFAAGVEVIAHLIYLRTWYTSFPPATTLALLLIFRKRFSVRSESRNIRLGFVLLLGSLFIALLYGTIGFWMLDKRDFGITFSMQNGLVRSLRQFLLLGNSDITAATRHARWFLQSLDVLGIVAAGFATYSLFRPIVYRLVQFPMERILATSILEKYGKSTFDYFKVWSDKSFYFSPSRQSFIAYRMVNGVAFCLADPVGPEEDRDAVMQNFLKFCTENGWQAAVMFPDDPANYTKDGLSLIKIGEEAVVDLEHFVVKTYQIKYFRYVRRKLEGEGYKVIQYKPPVSRPVLDEVAQVS